MSVAFGEGWNEDRSVYSFTCHCGKQITQKFDSLTKTMTMTHGEGEARRVFTYREIAESARSVTTMSPGGYLMTTMSPINRDGGAINRWVKEIHGYEGVKKWT